MQRYLAPEQFPPTFALSVAKLVVRDSFFLSQVKGSLPPEFFGGNEIGGDYIQQAVDWAYSFYDEHNYGISVASFDYQMNQYINEKPESDRQTVAAGIAHLRNSLFAEPIHDADFVRENVYGWMKQQAVKSMLVDMKEKLDKGQPIYEATYVDRLNEISAIGLDLSEGGVDLLRDLGWSYNYLTTEAKRDFISTGLMQFDKALSGGIGRKEMLVFEAPPNVGKTTVMASVTASLLKKGKRVVHITLEQDEKLILQKIVACMSTVRPHEFMLHPDIIKGWLEYMQGNGAQLMLKQFPTGKLTVIELQNYLRGIESIWGQKIDAVVIDYADLMRSSRNKDKRYEELSEIYTTLRGLAVMMDFALITATQTNRKGVKKEKITIEDLSECFEKAAIADVIIAICQTEMEHKSGAMRLHFAKNRIGEKFIEIPYKIDYVLAYLEEKEKKEGWGAYQMPTQTTGPLGFLNAGQGAA